ncbi:MAG: MFS transporter [Chloroflexi bacterium]|nr:MFS transporter [Chloroflexota bacterium]
MRRWYYGWSILGVLSVTETLAYGMLIYAFSVFVVPLETYFGWSRATINGAVAASQIIAGLLAWPVGIWLDRYGARWFMTFGAIWGALWFAVWGFVTEPWQHIVVWLMLGISMATVLYEPAFVVVANWFHHKRSQALTVLTFVAGFAIIIATPTTEWLIRQYGWRATAWVFAAVMLLLLAPILAIWLRHRPSDVGAFVDGAPSEPPRPQVAVAAAKVTEIIRDTGFWVLTIAFLFATSSLVVILQTFVPYLIDRGYSAAQAAQFAAIMGVLALPSRLIFTPLGAIVSRYTIATVLCVMQSFALVALIMMPGEWGVWACVVLFGLSFGAITPARAALFADRYGVLVYGAISGVLALVLTMSRAVVPLGVEIARPLFGDYASIYLVVGVVTTIGSLPILLIPWLGRTKTGTTQL